MPALGDAINKAELAKQVRGSSRKATRKNIAIHGPRKVGKSYFMCTASARWPVDIADRHEQLRKEGRVTYSNAEPVQLDDLLVFAVDDGALDFLNALNIEVPNVVAFDAALSAVGTDSSGLPDAEDALDVCIMSMQEAIKEEPGIEFVCIDTISVLDKALVEQISRRLSGFEVYASLLGKHRRLYGRLKAFGRHWVLNCHSKAIIELQSKNDEKGKKQAKDQQRRKEAQYHTPVDVVPDITGQGAQVWLANVSFQGVAMSKTNPTTRQKERRVYFDVVDGHEGGSRYTDVVDPNGETNLRALFERCGIVE